MAGSIVKDLSIKRTLEKSFCSGGRFSKAPKTFRAWGPFLESPENISGP